MDGNGYGGSKIGRRIFLVATVLWLVAAGVAPVLRAEGRGASQGGGTVISCPGFCGDVIGELAGSDGCRDTAQGVADSCTAEWTVNRDLDWLWLVWCGGSQCNLTDGSVSNYIFHEIPNRHSTVTWWKNIDDGDPMTGSYGEPCEELKNVEGGNWHGDSLSGGLFKDNSYCVTDAPSGDYKAAVSWDGQPD